MQQSTSQPDTSIEGPENIIIDDGGGYCPAVAWLPIVLLVVILLLD